MNVGCMFNFLFQGIEAINITPDAVEIVMGNFTNPITCKAGV